MAASTTLAPAYADQLPEIVVTADRVEEPIGQTGASVTVIPAAEVEKLGTKGVADVLRGVAGLDVDEAGGVGAATQVRLRGADSDETVVLVDGVQLTDPWSTSGQAYSSTTCSTPGTGRIEILRGSQSTLYGGQAMGGVISVITRKGAKTPRRTVTVEAGSYGTLVDPRDAVGRRRPLDLFARRQPAAQRRLSALRLPHRPAAVSIGAG